jgi:hypothetical protein
MSFDTNGNLFFVDYYNYVIQKITKATNIITTVAGNGTIGYYGDDGFATNAQFVYPFVDSIGFFYSILFYIFFNFL